MEKMTFPWGRKKKTKKKLTAPGKFINLSIINGRKDTLEHIRVKLLKKFKEKALKETRKIK